VLRRGEGIRASRPGGARGAAHRAYHGTPLAVRGPWGRSPPPNPPRQVFPTREHVSIPACEQMFSSIIAQLLAISQEIQGCVGDLTSRRGNCSLLSAPLRGFVQKPPTWGPPQRGVRYPPSEISHEWFSPPSITARAIIALAEREPPPSCGLEALDQKGHSHREIRFPLIFTLSATASGPLIRHSSFWSNCCSLGPRLVASIDVSN
jgi:hypothetical protein